MPTGRSRTLKPVPVKHFCGCHRNNGSPRSTRSNGVVFPLSLALKKTVSIVMAFKFCTASTFGRSCLARLSRECTSNLKIEAGFPARSSALSRHSVADRSQSLEVFHESIVAPATVLFQDKFQFFVIHAFGTLLAM